MFIENQVLSLKT